MFSWGAGECGQLGTGRCTNRETPEIVSFQIKDDGEACNSNYDVHRINKVENNKSDVCINDIACGNGHVLAVSSSGNIYSW